MSRRLRELIKSVRQCKTAQEERDVIAKESAALRKAFKEQDGRYRHRNVAKLMFMHMLGYPTHFGQMETLKLVASCEFPDKRLGYLGLMLLLDERQEVLMLVTNSLKNDLNSNDQYIVGLALTALGNICSVEMARDLSPEIERLLENSNPYLRKKAALCARRMVMRVPDVVESFAEKSLALLNDRNHGVVLTGTSLMCEVVSCRPEFIPLLNQAIPLLCRILKVLVSGGFAAEYDVGGVSDPYLQVQILRLLRLFSENEDTMNEDISDALAHVATTLESNKTAGYAVLYECVKTILATKGVGGLRVLAINILGKFLKLRDNNMRYVALSLLLNAVKDDDAGVQRHKALILECVKDEDETIRKKALDLLSSLVNSKNWKDILDELFVYLDHCPKSFKLLLTAKLCMLTQEYVTDVRDYVDFMLQIFLKAGKYVDEKACSTFLLTILNRPSHQQYACIKFATEWPNPVNDMFLRAAIWIVGEYYDVVPEGNIVLADFISRLTKALSDTARSETCNEYFLVAAAKLAHRLQDPATTKVANDVFERHSSSPNVEKQIRSVEYRKAMEYGKVSSQLFAHMPPDESQGDSMILDDEDTSVDLSKLLGLDEQNDTPLECDSSITSGNRENVKYEKAYSDEYLNIELATLSSMTSNGKNVDIEARYTSNQTFPLENFQIQAAVPKYMRLKLDLASSNVLPAHKKGAVTQKFHIVVSDERKCGPLAMKIRFMFKLGGKDVSIIADVKF